MKSQQRKIYESGKKSQKNRLTVCAIIILVIFGIFTARLADWQLVQGKDYNELAKRSTGYSVTTEATRGEILDCNGIGMVVNNTHYKIVFEKLYIDENSLDKNILKLIDILEKTGDNWENELPLSAYDGGCTYKKGKEEEIGELLSSDFLNLPENTGAEDCFNKLLQRYEISNEYDFNQKFNLVCVHYTMKKNGYSNSNPYVFSEDIKQTSVASVSENTQGISGIEVETYLVREAEDPDLAPHLLGALGSITEKEYEENKDSEKPYQLTDSIGKFGIELAFEKELKGVGGTKIIQKNSDGTIVDTVQTTDAQPGNTVYLTIDSSLQKTAVKSLAENVKAAKKAGEKSGGEGRGEDCETGAVVMLSVKDFSVLAAASYPTYDLNKYSEYGDYYVKLSNDENSPMYNRAFVGSFACGSVYKPCIAMAALEEGVIDSKTEIYCKRNYDYYPTNVVKCMHYHGDINLKSAIEKSCNYFFAETGRRLGIETAYLYAEKFGLGEYTGIEVTEGKGTLAGRDSKSWLPGNTVQAAIGQSDNAFTPLQLATYVATIANDGKRFKTHVVKKITNYERNQTLSENSPNNPQLVENCGVSQKNLDYVQEAMLSVTQESGGTAYSMFGDYKVKVAAKTGTAENAGSDHTTFICYAPYDNPEVAISVVIEHGARGVYSMQVAKDLLDAYFSTK